MKNKFQASNKKQNRVIYFSAAPYSIFQGKSKKTLTLWPLFMDEVQLPQGESHFEEAVYF